jgi:sugar (pentulose or hexulose) kinase
VGTPGLTEVLIGVDIGASSIKAGAFAPDGRSLALALRGNAPAAQDGHPEWFVWDAARLRAALEDALAEVAAAIPDPARIVSVAVAGFGADGAPFSDRGEQTYPIISWHDSRAEPQLERLVAEHGASELYRTTGYHPYAINTVCRWMWLREHDPSALDGTRWLMVPDIAAWWLSGEMRTDPTSASTTMAYDMRRDTWAAELLRTAGVSPAQLAGPGERIGALRSELAGVPAGTVVAVGGHDCEVGTFAATGELPDSTFVDITGTWEMLIVLSEEFVPSDELFSRWIDWERHTSPGVYLCQSLMPAGSVLQWLRDLAYASERDPWSAMVAEASGTEPGCGGVRLTPAFVPGMGPFADSGEGGTISGLRTTTARGQIARAAFEALCRQLRTQLIALERAMGRSCDSLRVLGGAQRNDFWLQLKADVTGVPVEVVETEELTLLGAALLGGVGSGLFGSLEEAQRAVVHRTRVLEPRREQYERYRELFES